MNRKDLRYLESEQLIQDAFIELIEKKGYRNVTVKDIADRALINRKTFYNHYESIDALFTNTIKIYIATLFEGVISDITDYENYKEKIYYRTNILLHNLSANKRIFTILLNDSSNHELSRQLGVEILKNFFSNSIIASLHKKVHHMPIELLSSYFIAIFTSVIKWFIQNIENYSEEETARMLVELISF